MPDVDVSVSGSGAPLLSFVMPAYNEAKFLVRSIPAIRRYVPQGWQAEIIVVDNQSTDATAAAAHAAGADVVLTLPGSVAALRNRGAAAGTGRILVFLDADVFLTPAWRDNIGAVVQELERTPHQLTGSWVAVPEDASFIERNWFAPQQRAAHSHVNSGHMIMRRETFDALGGFDEKLRTGEDVELSHRAAARGLAVIDRPALRAVHEGFPKTLWAFARREYWHGLGYYSSWRKFLGSPLAVLAQVMFLSLPPAGAASLWLGNALPLLGWLGAVALLLLLMSARMFRREGLWRIVNNTGIYFIYMLARFLSLLGAIGVLPSRASRSTTARV